MAENGHSRFGGISSQNGRSNEVAVDLLELPASQAQVIPDWLVDKFAIAGTRAECRAQVERLRDSGINQIAIIPYGAGGSDREETMREFMAAVL